MKKDENYTSSDTENSENDNLEEEDDRDSSKNKDNIKNGNSKCALVVGSETMSRIIDWNDRNTCVLFGDGAGAVILEKSNDPGILSTHIHADGAYQELLSVPAGISSNYELVKSNKAFIKNLRLSNINYIIRGGIAL